MLSVPRHLLRFYEPSLRQHLSLCQFRSAIHVFVQHLWNINGAVRLLELFQYRNQHSGNSTRRSIDCVCIRSNTIATLDEYIQTFGLEISAITAARNFSETSTARHPSFNIVFSVNKLIYSS